MTSSKCAVRPVRACAVAPWALAVSFVLAGCSVWSDPERRQCASASDCEALNDEVPTACVSGLCVAAESGECRRSSACTDGALCDTTTLRCVENPPCSADAQCARYDASPALICAAGACAQAECTEDAECSHLGVNGLCDGGRCVDAAWQCIGEPVVRSAEGETGTLRLKVLYAPSDGETPLAALDVRVCIPADLACATPVAAGSRYDADSGWLTVSGLRNGSRYVLDLRGESPVGSEALLEGDYFLSIPIAGTTEIAEPIYMFTASTRAGLAGAARTPLDAQHTGLVFARTVDCQGRAAAGVSMATDKSLACNDAVPGCKTTVFYLDTANIPHTEFTATDAAGFAGLVNAVPDVDNVLTFRRSDDEAPYASLLVRPRAGRVTYTTVFPGAY